MQICLIFAGPVTCLHCLHQYRRLMYVNNDFYPLLVIEICFDEQSMIVNEGQGLVMFTLTITNSVITYVRISFTVITTSVTANSRLKVW